MKPHRRRRARSSEHGGSGHTLRGVLEESSGLSRWQETPRRRDGLQTETHEAAPRARGGHVCVRVCVREPMREHDRAQARPGQRTCTSERARLRGAAHGCASQRVRVSVCIRASARNGVHLSMRERAEQQLRHLQRPDSTRTRDESRLLNGKRHGVILRGQKAIKAAKGPQKATSARMNSTSCSVYARRMVCPFK
eukprot:1601835-Pleurochrysis_carterae.AAC.5